MKNFTKFFALTIIFSIFLFGHVVLAGLLENCSNGICASVDDGLADGVTGINPAQTVILTFSVNQESDSISPPDCEGKNLYNAVKHYIAGGPNYEYLSPGSGQTATHTFNSGVAQQKNRYAGVFYCWNQSQGTNKAALDSLFGQIPKRWLTPEFNLTTRATTIDPNCAQITSCANYPVQNDCTGNRCNLSPACRWTGNACVGAAAGGSGPQSFEIKNPIGVETFEDLVGIIGRWIFNLAIPIAVIIIIYAGIRMLTAGADPKGFEKGREALKYAVIGLAIVLIGRGFVTLIQSILSLKD